jgi:hypothetical protein
MMILSHMRNTPGLRLLKDERIQAPTVVEVPRRERAESFNGIRCPLCSWEPSTAHRWSCYWKGTPEPFFSACGTVWNTFATKGRCPGCNHQWRWTSCLRCGQWSLHDDWYHEADGD